MAICCAQASRKFLLKPDCITGWFMRVEEMKTNFYGKFLEIIEEHEDFL